MNRFYDRQRRTEALYVLLRTSVTAIFCASLLAGIVPPPLLPHIAPAPLDPLAHRAAALLPDTNVALASHGAVISGQLFMDFNMDGSPYTTAGTIDPLETGDGATVSSFPTHGGGSVGWAGFSISVTDVLGVSNSGTINPNDGTYTLPTAGLAGDDYIITVTGPNGFTATFNRHPEQAFPASSAYTTTHPLVSHVENLTSNLTGYNIGIAPPSLCPHTGNGADNNANSSFGKVWTTCYVNGRLDDTSADAPQDVLVSLNYDGGDTADNPFIEHLDSKQELGSLHAIAYDERHGILYTAAFLKRHSVLGSEGIDGLYWMVYENNAVPNENIYSEGLADIPSAPSYGVEPGARDVDSADYNTPSTDAAAFTRIGDTGIGDIDISTDGRTLFVTNMESKSVDIYDLSGVIANPATGKPTYLNSYPVPAPGDGCEDVNHVGIDNTAGGGDDGVYNNQPFALTTIDGGTIYVGTVCANAPDEADAIGAAIFALDPASGFSATPVIEIPSSYFNANRGLIAGGVATGIDQGAANFRPWVSEWDDLYHEPWYGYGSGANAVKPEIVTHPQALFSDISVEYDGAMTLMFMDRTGHQVGAMNYDLVGSANGLWTGVVGGDIAHVCPNGDLEGTGSCTRSGNEWFANDFHGNTHQENATGGSWTRPRERELVTSAMDPDNNASNNSGGLSWYSTLDGGAESRSLNLYVGGLTEYYPPNNEPYLNGVSGKTNGIGDVEGCSLPVEIGDRVWLDLDGDGFQDPGEPALAGATITVKGSNLPSAGVTVRTDANGQWFLDSSDGLDHGVEYTIEIDLTNVTNLPTGATAADLESTNQNAVANDQLDSDLNDGNFTENGAGLYTITVPALEPGEINHSFDAGFYLDYDVAMTKQVKSINGSGAFTDRTVTFELEVTNQGAAPLSHIELTDVIDTTYWETFFEADNDDKNDSGLFGGAWVDVSASSSTTNDFVYYWDNVDGDTNLTAIIYPKLLEEAPIQNGGASEVHAPNDDLLFYKNETIVIELTLRIADTLPGTIAELINKAEMSEFDGDAIEANGDSNSNDTTAVAGTNLIVDEDSTPDADVSNDNQPTDSTDPTNNDISQDGKNGGDEDDHDPAYVPLFDLALVKGPGTGQSYRIDNSTTPPSAAFSITVKNQGLVTVTNVSVIDYIPTDMVFASGPLTVTVANQVGAAPVVTDGGAVGADRRFDIDELSPGESVTFNVVFQITNILTKMFVNGAEISQMQDVNGDPAMDIDSVPNTNPADDDIQQDAGVDPANNNDDNSHNDIDNDRDGSNDPVDTTSSNVPADERDEDDHDVEVLIYEIYDMALIKTVASADSPIAPGAVVTYNVTIANQGNVPSGAITVTDQIPAGMSFVSASDSGTENSGIVTWEIGASDQLTIAEQKIMTLTVQVNDTDMAPFRNWAEISADSSAEYGGDEDSIADTNTGNDSSPGTGTPPNDDADNHNDITQDDAANDEDDSDYEDIHVYDLALIKEIGSTSGPVTTGTIVTYTLTISNQGTLDSGAFEVIDEIPTGLSFVAASDSGSNLGQTVSWSIPVTQSVAVGGQKVLTLALQVLDTDMAPFRNWAEISSDSGADEDSAPDTNTGSDTGPGVGSNGDDDAENHNDLSFDDGTINGNPDEDDSDYEDLHIYDLALIKERESLSGIVQEGTLVTYTVTISNQGTLDSDAFTVVDTIPAGMSFVGASDGGINAGQTVTWTIPASADVDVGDLKVLRLTVQITDTDMAPFRNWAEIAADSGDDEDSVPDSNTGSDPGPGTGSSPNDLFTNHDDLGFDDGAGDEDDNDYDDLHVYDLALVKSVDSVSGPLQNGTVVTYSVQIINQGTLPSGAYTVTDVIPTGMSFVSASDSGVNTGQSVVWSISDANEIPVGGSYTLMVTAQIDDTSQAPFLNWAEITGDSGDDEDSTADGNTGDDNGPGAGTPPNDDVDNHNDPNFDDGLTSNGLPDEDDNDYEELNIYDLALVKQVSATSGAIANGAIITYSLTVANQGTLASGAYTVTDVLPAGMSFVSASNGGVNSGITTTWEITAGNEIAIGGQQVLELVAQVNDVTQAPFRNWAEISGDSGDDEDSTPDTNVGSDPGPGTGTDPNDPVSNHNDPNLDVPPGDEDDNDFEELNVYDLALIKEIASLSGPVQVGTQVTYSVTVANQGTMPSGEFTAVDVIPGGMSFVSASDAGIHSSGIVTWTIPAANELPVGQIRTLTLTVQIDDTSMAPFRNWAEIASGSELDEDSTPGGDFGSDPGPGTGANPTDDDVNNHNDITLDNPANDEDDSDYEDLHVYDLALIKTVGAADSPVVAGSVITYHVTVANQGTLASGAFTVTDQIPTGMTFVSASNGGTEVGGVVTWAIPISSQLAPSSQMTLELVVQIADLSQYPFRNWAEISEDSGDDEDSMPDANLGSDPGPGTGEGTTDPNDPVDDHNDITADEPANDEDDNDYADVNIEFVSLGSTVFNDNDDSGTQDAGESGIPNVLIELYDINGTLIATDTTDASGNYLFEDLLPGDYQVVIPTPPATAPSSSSTTSTGDDDVDGDDNGTQAISGDPVTSPVITLIPGAEPTTGEDGQGGGLDDAIGDSNGNMTVDFGFVPLVSLGSSLFYDNDNNGMQDAGEGGIPNVVVELYDISGTLVATTTTDVNGDYYFGDLQPGDYQVVIPNPPANAPMSSDNTDANDNGQDGDDNGIQTASGDPVTSPIITLTPDAESTSETASGGEQDDADPVVDDDNGDMTVDFGFVPLVSLGSTIFSDDNNDGTQGAGESGIAGVLVELYDIGGTLVATTTTDAMGDYYFGDLLPSDYQVVIPNPPADAPTSSTTTNTSDDDVDGDDNGIQSFPGGTVVSPIITLSPDTEPAGEPGQGGEQDVNDLVMDDDNGNMTIDFGFVPPSSLGSTLFYDNDNDGLQGAGEGGIAGVLVELYDISGTLVATDTTDASGNYLFADLLPSDYQVVISTPPTNAPLSSSNTDTADNGEDGDDNGSQSASGDPVTSPIITLLPDTEPTGETGQGGDLDDADDDNGDMTIDFGFVPPVSLGSSLFYDIDDSGTQDAGEPGIPGVVVELYDINGTLIATDTTDALGNYLFEDLLPSDYQVVISTPPTNAPLSSSNTDTADNGEDGDDNGSQSASGDPVTSPIITLMPDTESTSEAAEGGDQDAADDDNGDMTIDFGFVPLGSIGDQIWHDEDGDGLYEPNDGDRPLDGVVVILTDSSGITTTATTDADGNYLFENLPLGDYTVMVDPTTVPGDKLATPTGDPDGVMDGMSQVTLTLDNPDDLDQDFGYQSFGFIGDTIFHDEDSDGLYEPNDGDRPLDGVVVILTDSSGNTMTTTTDASGNYLFEDLPFGDYTVTVNTTTLPDDKLLDPTYDPDGGADSTSQVSLTPENPSDLDQDFGYEPQYGLIGDTIFHDEDGDGLYEPEDGDRPLKGVVVILTDSSGNTMTTTTDASGNYLFEDLPFGDYTVTVNTTTLPDDKLLDPTYDPDGGADSTSQVSLTPENPSDLDQDFGYEPQYGLIGDTIFHDEDGDGLYEPEDGDRPLKGVVVILTDSSGVTTTTTTDSSGNYLFTDLPLGDYTVTVDTTTLPDDKLLDPTYDPDGGADSTSQVTLTPENPSDLDQDFGYEPQDGLIGDTIFHDEDGDGLYEPENGDRPLEDVVVILTDSSGVTTTTTTDSSGNYLFTDLPLGDYTVTVDTTTLPDDKLLDPTYDPDGGADSTSQVALTPENPSDLDQDFGYEPQDGLIGDTIFHDEDGDGLYEPENGDRPLEDVVVILTDSSGVTTTTTTDSSGNYLFTDLPLGDYTVTVDTTTLPDDKLLDPTYDPDGGADSTSQVTLTPENPSDLDQDFGYEPQDGLIGDTIFHDEDGDGLYEPEDGDRPLEGVVVILTDSSGVTTTTTTDSSGNYLFTDLPLGDYTVTVDTTTLPDDKLLDPTYDPDGGADSTSQVALTPENPSDLDQDFGYEPQDGLIGDTIFHDEDQDGIYEPEDGDRPLEGVVVILTDSSGNTITTTTNSAGNYLFDNLPLGDYTVIVDTTTLPNEKVSTPTFDPDGGADSTSQVSLTPELPNNLDQDFGYRPGASIGQWVWEDLNKDGIRDANEPGVSAVTVTLRNTANEVIAITTTGPDGYFEFIQLTPGDYILEFEPTQNWNFTEPGVFRSGEFNSDADPETGRTSTISLEPGENDPEWGAGLIQVDPTAISLSSFTVMLAESGDALAIRWVTSTEIDTFGFHIMRSTDGTIGNAEIITSQMLTSHGTTGGIYEVVLPYNPATDPPAEQSTFWLYEAEIGDVINYYGPASVQVDAAQLDDMIFLPFLSR